MNASTGWRATPRRAEDHAFMKRRSHMAGRVSTISPQPVAGDDAHCTLQGRLCRRWGRVHGWAGGFASSFNKTTAERLRVSRWCRSRTVSAGGSEVRRGAVGRQGVG